MLFKGRQNLDGLPVVVVLVVVVFVFSRLLRLHSAAKQLSGTDETTPLVVPKLAFRLQPCSCFAKIGDGTDKWR